MSQKPRQRGVKPTISRKRFRNCSRELPHYGRMYHAVPHVDSATALRDGTGEDGNLAQEFLNSCIGIASQRKPMHSCGIGLARSDEEGLRSCRTNCETKGTPARAPKAKVGV